MGIAVEQKHRLVATYILGDYHDWTFTSKQRQLRWTHRQKIKAPRIQGSYLINLYDSKDILFEASQYQQTY